jgi:organic radical activating enzyme
MSEPVCVTEIFSSIQGEGFLAGRRQVFVRLAECNLNCRYCDTIQEKTGTCRVETHPGSAAFRDLPQPVELQTLLKVIKEWVSELPGAHHSVSLTGGEPLLSADALRPWLPEIRRLLPIHLETNGTMYLALNDVIQHIDYVSMDMKLPSTSGCTEHLWDLHHHFLRVAHGHNVSVKIVVGDDTDTEEIRHVCDIIASVDRAVPLFLQPLTLPGGSIGITAAHVMRLQELASSLLPDVRVMPQMHKLLGIL